MSGPCAHLSCTSLSRRASVIDQLWSSAQREESPDSSQQRVLGRHGQPVGLSVCGETVLALGDSGAFRTAYSSPQLFVHQALCCRYSNSLLGLPGEECHTSQGCGEAASPRHPAGPEGSGCRTRTGTLPRSGRGVHHRTPPLLSSGEGGLVPVLGKDKEVRPS